MEDKMINTNSDILNKLFFEELKQLVRKYNDMDTSTKDVIEVIMSNIEDEKLVVYLINNPIKLEEVVNTVKIDRINLDIVTFFTWINSKIKDISMVDAIIKYKELAEIGYLEIEGYLLYKDKKYLKEYAKLVLEDMLDDEYMIDRLFNKEVIIDFWINKTDKQEIIEEIISNDDLEEVLDIHPKYAFKVSNSIEYKYSMVEN
jgi:hypothetical protein